MQGKHLGIPETEASDRRESIDWRGAWRAHPLAINVLEDGTLVIASIPSGRGTDLILGMKCEIWLFTDGTYALDALPSWVSRSERRAQEGYHQKLGDGCFHHPHCSTCPFPDCIAKDGEF